MENVSLTFVPSLMTKKAKCKRGSYRIITLDYAASSDGHAYLAVAAADFKRSVDEEGVPAVGYVDVLLGRENSKRRLIIKNADGEFEFVEVSVEEIVQIFELSEKPEVVTENEGEEEDNAEENMPIGETD